MAKKKTRKQKVLADSRHVLYHLETNISAQVSHPSEKIKVQLAGIPQINQTQTLNSYAHVITDIRKTALITGAILLTQIILFFVINRV